MSKKIISYALWGNNPLYNKGILINIEQAKKYYPEWCCRVYCDPNSPAFKELNCEVIPFEPLSQNGQYSWTNLMKRYYSAASDMDYCIFRDADSRLNDREAQAVNEWMRSGKSLHVMHDDPAHYRWSIGGGMWGIKGNCLKNIVELSNNWLKGREIVTDKQLAIDEVFLHEIVWPMFQNDYIGHGVHDRWPVNKFGNNEHLFPKHEPLEFGRYIGQVIQISSEYPKLPRFFRSIGQKHLKHPA